MGGWHVFGGFTSVAGFLYDRSDTGGGGFDVYEAMFLGGGGSLPSHHVGDPGHSWVPAAKISIVVL